MKTEQIIVRVNPEIKAEAIAIFRKIEISASEAVNLFLTHIITEKGIPSDMHIPNKETLRAFQDSDSGRNVTAGQCPEATLSWYIKPLRVIYNEPQMDADGRR